MRGKDTITLPHDPAPDVVLEIDLTTSRMAKNDIYAAMAVPELWRHDGADLRAFVLDGSQYVLTEKSLAFPHLSFAEVNRHSAMAHDEGRLAALISWQRWLEANR